MQQNPTLQKLETLAALQRPRIKSRYVIIPAILAMAIYCFYATSNLLRASAPTEMLVSPVATAKVPVRDPFTAEVNQVQGIFIFTDSKPIADYQYLGTATTKGVTYLNPQYNTIRDALIKQIKKEYPQADGIIFYFNNGGADKADAIKLQP